MSSMPPAPGFTLPPLDGSTLRVTIHGRDFSDYGTLSEYLRKTYPVQHSQLWDQIFRGPSSF